MKVYLCGPINGRSDADCIDWRANAKSLLKCDTINPMDRDYRGKESANVRDIVENDKFDISASDALLVYFDKPSVGTSMEVLFAFNLRRPVYLVDASGKPLSPWLLYHATKIFPSVADACKEINNAFLARNA